jgi:hypothetical protein
MRKALKVAAGSGGTFVEGNGDQYWKDYMESLRDSLPLVRDPSGGQARMTPGCRKPDCVAMMRSSVSNGGPFQRKHKFRGKGA